jgi:hypothetical protein
LRASAAVKVLGSDLGGAVGECVEEREADHVRLSAGGDLADDPVLWLGELLVGVMPELAGVRVETNLPGLAGVLQRRGE